MGDRREPDARTIATGLRIARARKTAGLRQDDLATATGLSRSSIANIESGRQELSLTNLRAIADALGTTIEALGTASDTAPDPGLTARPEPRPKGLHIRQQAWDTVHAYLRKNPPQPSDPYTEACENARVWRAVQYALDAVEHDLVAVAQLRAAHIPVPNTDDTGVDRRCSLCVAGYDPKTNDLVFCAWPCPTVAIIDGEAT